MYALVIELVGGLAAAPPLAMRWRHRELVARLPGYRRRLELQADGYRRLVEVYLFDGPEQAAAALDDPGRCRLAAGALGEVMTERGLLVCAGDARGTPTVLLRRARPMGGKGGPPCWRDRLNQSAAVTEQW